MIVNRMINFYGNVEWVQEKAHLINFLSSRIFFDKHTKKYYVQSSYNGEWDIIRTKRDAIKFGAMAWGNHVIEEEKVCINKEDILQYFKLFLMEFEKGIDLPADKLFVEDWGDYYYNKNIIC